MMTLWSTVPSKEDKKLEGSCIITDTSNLYERSPILQFEHLAEVFAILRSQFLTD